MAWLRAALCNGNVNPSPLDSGIIHALPRQYKDPA